MEQMEEKQIPGVMGGGQLLRQEAKACSETPVVRVPSQSSGCNHWPLTVTTAAEFFFPNIPANAEGEEEDADGDGDGVSPPPLADEAVERRAVLFMQVRLGCQGEIHIQTFFLFPAQTRT